jgi:DNA/RNA endonuclease G (NUC1)
MFYEDQGIEERFRSKLADYQEAGYDRGHMVGGWEGGGGCRGAFEKPAALWGPATRACGQATA